MGKADFYESDYLEDAEIFADLVNGVLYNGEQVVKPEELQEKDGELRSASENGARKAIRDKVRLWNGTVLAVIAVENQTGVDYHMVIRNMLSESMAYDQQWKRKKAEHRKRRKAAQESRMALAEDEFISGMRKDEKFLPVITIVVYYGRKKPWDGARTLYELLDIKGDREKILPFISNYRLNLFDYHDYDSFGQFHTELQSVFEFLRYAGDKEKLRERLEHGKERYGSLSNEAKALLAQLANIKRISGVPDEKLKKGDFDMCKAFEDMKEEGRLEGKEEGRLEGKEEGRLEGKLEGRLEGVRNLMDTMKWTAKQAMEALKIPENEQEMFKGYLL